LDLWWFDPPSVFFIHYTYRSTYPNHILLGNFNVNVIGVFFFVFQLFDCHCASNVLQFFPFII
jgi:hypothetical protein